ncbi:hypothetical protein KJ750_00685 [Patescibacteria group bacterium]|nr:hypothetical protein [Patescibacteria group bacterium]
MIIKFEVFEAKCDICEEFLWNLKPPVSAKTRQFFSEDSLKRELIQNHWIIKDSGLLICSNHCDRPDAEIAVGGKKK